MSLNQLGNRSTVARNSVFNLLGQLLPIGAGLLATPYIVRGLGPDGYGILAIAYMVLGYFSIFDLGLSRATVKFVAEHLTPEKRHKVPELVWTSLALLLLLGCGGGAVVAAFVPVAVTHFFKMPASFVGEAKVALVVLAVSMPIILGSDALRGVLEATQRFDLVNYVKVPGSVAFYLLAAAAIPFKIGVAGIVCLLVMVRAITALAYLILCLRVLPELRERWRFSWQAVRPLASFGGWIMVSNIAAPVFGSLERFVIASVLSVSALAYYSAPFELVSRLVIFPAAIAPTLFPYFSYYGGHNLREVSDTTSRSLKYLLLLITPVTAVFVFFARQILLVWLGPNFASHSTEVMQILAIGVFWNALAYVPYTSVQALGRPDLKATLDLVALPAYAVGCWVLTHQFQINGAAWAKLLITIADTSVLFVFAWRMKSFSIRDCTSGPVLRALIASGGLLAMVYLVASLHLALLVSAFLVTICFALYAAAFWILAVDAEERAVVTMLVRRAVGIPEPEAETVVQ